MKYTCENKLRNFDAWAGGMNLDGSTYFQDED